MTQQPAGATPVRDFMSALDTYTRKVFEQEQFGYGRDDDPAALLWRERADLERLFESAVEHRVDALLRVRLNMTMGGAWIQNP